MLKCLDKEEEIVELQKSWYELADHSIFSLQLSKDELFDSYIGLKTKENTSLDLTKEFI